RDRQVSFNHRLVVHRFDAVQRQVEDDLLQLNPIGGYRRQDRLQTEGQADLTDDQLAVKQTLDLGDNVVQVELLRQELIARDPGAHASDDVSRPQAGLGNLL